jgi:hypothetical protein
MPPTKLAPNSARPRNFGASHARVTLCAGDVCTQPVQVRSSANIVVPHARCKFVQPNLRTGQVTPLNAQPTLFDSPLRL